MGKFLQGTPLGYVNAKQTVWVRTDEGDFPCIAETEINSAVVTIAVQDNGTAHAFCDSAPREIHRQVTRLQRGYPLLVSPKKTLIGGIKFLLRTGPDSLFPSTNYDSLLWYIGGDRPEPTLIDKSGLTMGTQWEAISLVATGPGLDDWVVCAVDNRGAGGRIAFLNASGVMKVDTLTVPLSGGISTSSTGNFASRISVDSSSSTAYWYSDLASGGGISSGGYDPTQGFYFLPDVFRNPGLGVVARNLKRQAVANSELSYSLRAPNPSGHTLYRADGSRTSLGSQIIANPASGLIGSDATLQMFSQPCSLVDLVLWRWTGLLPSEITQTVTQEAQLIADRWQLYDDATWNYLPRVPITYYLNAGLVRIDISGWVDPSV